MSLLTNLQAAFTRIGAELKARTPKALTLAANTPSSSTTPTAVAGLSFNAVVGRRYHVKFIGEYQTVATATGCRLGFIGTVGVSSIRGRMRGGISAGTVATELARPITSTAAVLVTSGATPVGVPHHLGAEYVFVCSASGTHGIRFGSEVAGSQATLLAGSTLIYQEF